MSAQRFALLKSGAKVRKIFGLHKFICDNRSRKWILQVKTVEILFMVWNFRISCGMFNEESHWTNSINP